MEHFAECGYHDFKLAANLKVTTVEAHGAYGNMPIGGGSVGAKEKT